MYKRQLQLRAARHIQRREPVAVAHQRFQLREVLDARQVGNGLVIDVYLRYFGDLLRGENVVCLLYTSRCV